MAEWKQTFLSFQSYSLLNLSSRQDIKNVLGFLLNCKAKKKSNKGPSDVKVPGCCQTQRTKGDILYTQLNNTQLMHYSLLDAQEACKYFIKGELVRPECNCERQFMDIYNSKFNKVKFHL